MEHFVCAVSILLCQLETICIKYTKVDVEEVLMKYRWSTILIKIRLNVMLGPGECATIQDIKETNNEKTWILCYV